MLRCWPVPPIEGGCLAKSLCNRVLPLSAGGLVRRIRRAGDTAVRARGGRILARGLPSKIYEAGINERVTLIEFDSLEQAIATREGGAYQAAFAKLGNVVRDVRIIEAS
jgi:uncharacterized protein (DUF1330 family)